MGFNSFILYISVEAIEIASQPIFGVKNPFSNPVTWVIIIGAIETIYALRGIEKII